MKTITIKLDSGQVEISKLPIGKYAELLQAIKQIPKNIQGLEAKDTQGVIEMLPVLVAQSLPDFIEILTIATPLKKEQVEQMGLDEVTRVVVAIIEANNFREVYENIKKVTARPEAVKVAK